jgi:hypothetical protein
MLWFSNVNKSELFNSDIVFHIPKNEKRLFFLFLKFLNNSLYYKL